MNLVSYLVSCVDYIISGVVWPELKYSKAIYFYNLGIVFDTASICFFLPSEHISEHGNLVV